MKTGEIIENIYSNMNKCNYEDMYYEFMVNIPYMTSKIEWEYIRNNRWCNTINMPTYLTLDEFIRIYDYYAMLFEYDEIYGANYIGEEFPYFSIK